MVVLCLVIEMSSLCEGDSDESDIFEVSWRKQVGRLTKQKAFEIKKIMLDRESVNSSFSSQISVDSTEPDNENVDRALPVTTGQKRNVEFDDNDDISILEEKINKSNVKSIGFSRKEDKTPVKKETTHVISPSKLISDYFTPTQRATENSNTGETSASADSENIRKRLWNGSDEMVSVKTRLDGKIRKINQGRSNCDNFSNLDNHNNLELGKNKRQSFFTKFIYSESLKTIVHFGVQRQALLEQKAAREGKTYNRLFSDSEFQAVEKFFKLPANAFEMFARMLCRRKGWHRIHTIHYEDMQEKAEDIFKSLSAQQFVDVDVDKENMEVLLNLLNKSEVQILCKAFNIKVTGTGSKKCDLIEAILKSGKNQRAVTEVWTMDYSSKRELLFKNHIVKTLGPCMKLNENFLSLLNKFLLLFCLPFYIEEEDKWSFLIHMVNEVHMNKLSYPNYEVKQIVIFEKREDFNFYVEAMELKAHCDAALLQKKNEKFDSIGQAAKTRIKKLLGDESFKERVINLPPFLRRFNAGSIYAKILTIYCEKYKRSKTAEEVVEIMEMLINQDLFAVNKKGLWYNLLVQAYSDLGKSSEAGLTVLKALKENTVNEVEKLKLQQKGGLLLKKKKNALGKGELRDELDGLCTIDLTEPSKVVINARAMDKNRSGYKSVYVHKDKAGALTFSSVEETVIDHYRANGFPQGVHAEGFIVQTMYFLVFFDIIYKLSPNGVFQSSYQTEPLDFSSRSFYLNRKAEIDSRLREMRSWSFEKFEDLIMKVYTDNLGVQCVITWKDPYTPKLFCEILRCMGVKQFTSICERLVQNFRVYRSGFPDLTVWNPATKKCKFVEVKSPNDKLSANQRLWLDFLKKLNIDCEVCSVKNIASRSA